MKHYQIGDFARHMGVTADFLKHYEKAGLIDVKPMENGYRSYPFDQSGYIIGYQRLKNYGVTIREIKEHLESTEDCIMHLLDDKVEAMKTEALRLESVIEEHERLKIWFQARKEKPVDWEVKRIEPICFLAHTDSQDFRQEDGMHEILPAWVSWMPVTKSTLSVEFTPEGEDNRIHWGFAVPESQLKRYNIPRNACVKRFSLEKAFVYHFSRLEGAFSLEALARGTHPAFALMRSLGYDPTGTGLLIRELKMRSSGSKPDTGLGRFLIPIVSR